MLAMFSRVQRAARRNGAVYHMGGAEAFLRTLALMATGGCATKPTWWSIATR